MSFGDVDLSGRIKMETLEQVYLSQITEGWCSAPNLHVVLGEGHLYRSGWRCISIRLLRYCRQGLLLRRRNGRRYEYRLSEKGEDRLLYLYEKFSLRPGWEFRGNLGRIEKELAKTRRRITLKILESQNKRDEEKLRELDRSSYRS